jgi:hypothetical protein
MKTRLNDDVERMNKNDNTRLWSPLTTVTKACKMSRGGDDEIGNVKEVYYNC